MIRRRERERLGPTKGSESVYSHSNGTRKRRRFLQNEVEVEAHRKTTRDSCVCRH